MRLFALLLVLLGASTANADPLGYLLLPLHDDISERAGAATAQLYVYDEEGTVVAVDGHAGQFEAGDYVPLAPGWYFIEVGRYRTPSNAMKIYVEADHVTVVPTGWVSVRTPPLSEQTAQGCSQWTAELSAFAVDASGTRALTHSNRGTGVSDWGAIQLLAGEHVVFFNQLPTTVSVVEDEMNEVPTGYQDPMYGGRPMLSTAPDGDPDAVRVSLCETGALQVPAGAYWASGAVPTETYPYERRDWEAVRVPPSDDLERRSLRSDRLEFDRFEGEGATPIPLTPEERERLGEGGTRVRLPGFDR